MGLFDFLGGGDYGAGGYKNAYESNLRQQGAIGGQFGNLAGQSGLDFGNFNNNYKTSLDDYAHLLRQDPYTDSYSTAAINKATSGLTGDYLNAKASLTADLARRGLAAPGQNSSMLTGGLASIEASRAGALSNAQNNLAMDKINRQYQNAALLPSLYGNAADTAYGRTTGALGAQAGILGNVGQGQMNLYQNALQQQQQNANGILGLIGTAAQTAPYFL